MTIGPAIDATLSTLRAEAESLMVDTCDLQRRSSTSTMDPQTGEVTHTWETYWMGPCRLRVRNTDRAGYVAEEATTVVVRELQLPVAAPLPNVGHRVVIARGEEAATLHVAAMPSQGTHLVMRRVHVETREVIER